MMMIIGMIKNGMAELPKSLIRNDLRLKESRIIENLFSIGNVIIFENTVDNKALRGNSPQLPNAKARLRGAASVPSLPAMPVGTAGNDGTDASSMRRLRMYACCQPYFTYK
jgi:hypothetical protein